MAIRADPSFRKCQWTAEEIDMFLYPIEVHVKAALAVRNRCEEALTLIRRKWDLDAKEYIRCQSLVERSLKLIASVANCRDVPDLKTGFTLGQYSSGQTNHGRKDLPFASVVFDAPRLANV